MSEYPIQLCRGCEQLASECVCIANGISKPERVVVIPDETADTVRALARDYDIRKDEYAQEEDSLFGACYPVAETYYHLTGCERDVYCLSWSDVDPELEGTHWYLREPRDGRFVDLAIPAESGTALPPFDAGTRRGFITGDEPSKRAQKLLDVIQSEPIQ